MLTQMIRRGCTLLFISLTLTAATPVFSQSAHHHIALDAAATQLLDSTVAPHLQVYFHQLEKDVMRFRLAVLNPDMHVVSIMIRKGDDIYFTEVVREDHWDNVLNMSSLEDGEYELLVNNGKEKIVRSLTIRTDTHVERQVILN